MLPEVKIPRGIGPPTSPTSGVLGQQRRNASGAVPHPYAQQAFVIIPLAGGRDNHRSNIRRKTGAAPHGPCVPQCQTDTPGEPPARIHRGSHIRGPVRSGRSGSDRSVSTVRRGDTTRATGVNGQVIVEDELPGSFMFIVRFVWVTTRRSPKTVSRGRLYGRRVEGLSMPDVPEVRYLGGIGPAYVVDGRDAQRMGRRRNASGEMASHPYAQQALVIIPPGGGADNHESVGRS